MAGQRLTTRFSIFWAIADAVEKGALELEFHGVDMEGIGYAGGLNPRLAGGQQSDEAWNRRWIGTERTHGIPLETSGLRAILARLDSLGVSYSGLPEWVTDGVGRR
jgi:hypothetical protein